MCPGSYDFFGYGEVSLTNSGWQHPRKPGSNVEVRDNISGLLALHLGDRAYVADLCEERAYIRTHYSAMKLLGKRLRYTTDISRAGCGCNVAMYLVAMQQNPKPSDCGDYYCDANEVCGVACAEIDIQEANRYAWHSTLHSAKDKGGMSAGYGGGGKDWNGPRDFGPLQFGPSANCVDTQRPFEVAASFPVGADGMLMSMEVTLSQKHGNNASCHLPMRVADYSGLADLTEALAKGMTPVVSYWSAKDMGWMDGKGLDQNGPCEGDEGKCQDTAKFYNFAVEAIRQASGEPRRQPPAVPSAPGAPSAPARSECTETGQDCRKTHCCRSPGMQCYEKNPWWSACKEACIPGYSHLGEDTTWSCRPLGERTPDDRKQDVIVLNVAQQEMPPNGSEVTLVMGDQQLLAKVVQQKKLQDEEEEQQSRGAGSQKDEEEEQSRGAGSQKERAPPQGPSARHARRPGEEQAAAEPAQPAGPGVQPSPAVDSLQQSQDKQRKEEEKPSGADAQKEGPRQGKQRKEEEKSSGADAQKDKQRKEEEKSSGSDAQKDRPRQVVGADGGSNRPGVDLLSISGAARIRGGRGGGASASASVDGSLRQKPTTTTIIPGSTSPALVKL